MRRLLLFVSLLIGIVAVAQSFQLWQNIENIRNQNQFYKDEIKKKQENLKYLENLAPMPIDAVEANYILLDKQVRTMSHYYGLKFSLDNFSSEGIVSKVATPSSWPGIRQMLLIINFYELKGRDQYHMVFNFLETIERLDAISICNIVQKGNILQAEIKLYGR